MNVLLVDDSGTMRKIQRNVLTSIGVAEVVEAGDGIEALEKLKTSQVDLVLTDWNMPNMDGLAFVKAVRAGGSKIPILMVTTEAEKRRVIEAVKAGVNGYVLKPFTPDTLSAKIKEVLG